MYKNAKEAKLAKITSTEDENKYKCSSCTLFLVLFLVIFTTNVGIGTYFVYYTYINWDKETGVKYDFFLSNNNLINL